MNFTSYFWHHACRKTIQERIVNIVIVRHRNKVVHRTRVDLEDGFVVHGTLACTSSIKAGVLLSVACMLFIIVLPVTLLVLWVSPLGLDLKITVSFAKFVDKVLCCLVTSDCVVPLPLSAAVNFLVDGIVFTPSVVLIVVLPDFVVLLCVVVKVVLPTVSGCCVVSSCVLDGPIDLAKLPYLDTSSVVFVVMVNVLSRMVFGAELWALLTTALLNVVRERGLFVLVTVLMYVWVLTSRARDLTVSEIFWGICVLIFSVWPCIRETPVVVRDGFWEVFSELVTVACDAVDAGLAEDNVYDNVVKSIFVEVAIFVEVVLAHAWQHWCP